MQIYSLPQNAEGLYKKAKRTRDCSVGVYTKNKDHDVFLSCFASMLTYMAHAFKMKEVLDEFEFVYDFGVDVAYELVTKPVTPESINAAMKLIMDNDTDYIQLAEFAYRQAKAEGIIKE
jgi:hypothetical protein